MLINEQYILKEGSYLADIASSDFITMRRSEKGVMLKLHFDTKEIRYECKIQEAEEILSIWSEFKGNKIDFDFVEWLGE